MTERRADQPPADLTLDDLWTRHPGWTIWTSSTGRYWATWHHQLTKAEYNAECSRTVDAADAQQMDQVLTAEDEKRQAASQQESLP